MHLGRALADATHARLAIPAFQRELLGHPVAAVDLDGAVDDAAEDLARVRSEEHTSELQSQSNLVCRLLLEKKKKHNMQHTHAVNQTHVSHHVSAAMHLGQLAAPPY